MAFCTKCGRQLQEGEVCTCQQTEQTPVQPVNPQPAQAGAPVAPAQPSASSAFVMDLWETVLGLIKKPVETATAYVKKGSFPMAAIIIGIVMLFQSLFSMFGSMASQSKDSVDSLLGLFGALSDKPNYFAIFMDGLLDVLVGAVLVALIYMVLVQAIGGGKITYVQGLSIVSLQVVWSIAAIPVAFLISLIPVNFFSALASWISVFAGAMGTVYVIVAVKSVIVKQNMLPYIIACAMVVNAISTYIISLMFQ